MIKPALPFFAIALLIASPAFGQDGAEFAASDGSATASSISFGYGSYGNFVTADERFNFIMNNVGNNPNACITRSDYAYLQRYMDDHPELRSAVEQDFISPDFCE
jgi:hypothetical protein